MRTYLVKALKVALWTPVVLAILIAAMWATAALAIDVRISWLGTPLAIVFALAVVTVFVFVRPWRRALLGFALLFLIVLGWWFTLQPTNNRDWAPDVAELPGITIEGDIVTIRNVRNFEYRSETDFTPRYDTRTYDLSKLRTLDFFCSYWAGPSIAHTFLSFGFDDGQQLVLSVETRKVKGESYSAVMGFFRQYELIYIFADERDIVRVRTNFRGEHVYMFRTRASGEKLRSALVKFLRRAEHLDTNPAWYNALTDNCTNNLFAIGSVPPASIVFRPRILLTGYADEYLYHQGSLATQVPFDELKAESLIDAKAIAAGDSPDFSKLIRVGEIIPQ